MLVVVLVAVAVGVGLAVPVAAAVAVAEEDSTSSLHSPHAPRSATSTPISMSKQSAAKASSGVTWAWGKTTTTWPEVERGTLTRRGPAASSADLT